MGAMLSLCLRPLGQPSRILVIVGWLGCAMAYSGPKNKVTGQLIKNQKNQSNLVVLNYAHLEHTDEKLKKARSNSHAVSLAKAPTSGGSLSAPVPTFASELSASVMNEELRSKIDDEYIRKLKSFMYFHGYDATSRDARGRFHEIDAKKEIQVRQEMAKSMRSYMLSRGVPKFLMSRDDTKHLGETYQKVVDSTHIDVSFGTQTPEDRTPPWQLKTGMNPFNFTSYFRITNEIWTFESKNKLTDYRQMDITMNRKLGKYEIGNRYSVLSYLYTPYLDYSVNENLKTGVHSNLPLKSEKLLVETFTTVNLEYQF